MKGLPPAGISVVPTILPAGRIQIVSVVYAYFNLKRRNERDKLADYLNSELKRGARLTMHLDAGEGK